MKRLIIFILFTSVFSVQSIFSQNTISGKVTDSRGEFLPGVCIVLKGTTIATITDFEGNYQLVLHDSISAEPILVFSYVGMNTQEVKLNDNHLINVKLSDAELSLDEVVVVGDSRSSLARKVKGIVIRGVSSLSGKKSERHARRSETIKKGSIIESEHIHGTSTSSVNNGQIQAGTLTAGEIHDFSKWELWKDIDKSDLKAWQKHWQVAPQKRYCVQLVNHSGAAIVNQEVFLINEQKDTVWSSFTDNTGKAELWVNIFDDDSLKKQKYSISTYHSGKEYAIRKAKEFHKKVNILDVEADCGASKAIDIAFVVDATASMSDEIEYLKTELQDIISRARDSLPEAQLNLGSVFYRDKGDEYLTRHSDFSSDLSITPEFIKNNHAAGGGDTPEAVDAALSVAIDSMRWRKNTVAKILFLILDAPPHSDEQTISKINSLTRKAATKGIRIVPITCSGIDKSTEYLMRAMALATNGTYIFLTDHSGVGNPHIEPTTDSYDVTLLNELLLKTIINFSKVIECPKNEVNNAVLVEKKHEKIASSTTDSIVSKNTSKENIIQTKEKNEAFQWKYYPNPTSGEVNIDFQNSVKEIFVCDLSGKIIQRHTSPQINNFKINLSDFPNGIYFIRFLTDKGEKITGKVVLQR